MSAHEDEAQCETAELHIQKLEAALEAERAKVARLREAVAFAARIVAASGYEGQADAMLALVASTEGPS